MKDNQEPNAPAPSAAENADAIPVTDVGSLAQFFARKPAQADKPAPAPVENKDGQDGALPKNGEEPESREEPKPQAQANAPAGNGEPEKPRGDAPKPDADQDSPQQSREGVEAIDQLLSPKSKEKVQKRFNAMTAEKKELQARVAELEKKLASAKQPAGISDTVAAADEGDLDSIQTQAERIIDYYNEHGGDEELSLEGQPVTREVLTQLRNEARGLLKTAIPARRKALAQAAALEADKARVNEAVGKLFPEFEDEASEDGKWMRDVYNGMPELQQVPNGKMLVALARRGLNAMSAVPAKPPAKPKKPDPKPLPGMDGTSPAGASAPAAPHLSALEQKVAKGESLTEEEAAQYFATKKRKE